MILIPNACEDIQREMEGTPFQGGRITGSAFAGFVRSSRVFMCWPNDIQTNKLEQGKR